MSVCLRDVIVRVRRRLSIRAINFLRDAPLHRDDAENIRLYSRLSIGCPSTQFAGPVEKSFHQHSDWVYFERMHTTTSQPAKQTARAISFPNRPRRRSRKRVSLIFSCVFRLFVDIGRHTIDPNNFLFICHFSGIVRIHMDLLCLCIYR